jgi:hypothetical protein
VPARRGKHLHRGRTSSHQIGRYFMGGRNADFGELAGEVLRTSQHRASPFDPIARFDRHIRSRGVTINLDCAALSSARR